MSSDAAARRDSNQDDELRQRWDALGRVDRYEAPGEQELRDLADLRNRGRGIRTQRQRLQPRGASTPAILDATDELGDELLVGSAARVKHDQLPLCVLFILQRKYA